MQFQVPQFIYTEDKLVGPLTFKQFMYVGIPGAIIAILFFFLEFLLWTFLAAVIGGIGLVLAFGKVNGRPMSVFFSALFENLWSPNFYVFKPSVPMDTAPTRPIQTEKHKSLNLPIHRKPKTHAPKVEKAPPPVETPQATPTPAVTMSSFPKTESEPQIQHELPQSSPEPVQQSSQKPATQNTYSPIHHKYTPSFGGINGLREWLSTSRTAIPRREKPLPRNFGTPKKEIDGRYEVVRHITGEREVAKRIDYR